MVSLHDNTAGPYKSYFRACAYIMPTSVLVDI